MGVVLLATHVHLRQKVAVKLLHPETAVRRGAVERFLREARVAMSLRGEHVVRIFDVGTLDDGSPFIAMERLEGRDFGAMLDAAAPLSPAIAVDYVLQAIEAVAEAHALGVVHRDLKPANLFLTKRVDGSPCVKVLDFGVSKIDEGAAAAELDDTAGSSRDDDARPLSEPPPSQDRITRGSAVVGSPRYMAPEQILSPRDVDARADVWAFGVILYELVTGAPPFEGRTLDELRANVMKAPVPPMRDVPSGLQAVVRRCLSKAPGDRPASVHALAELLAPFASADGDEAAARIGRIVGGGNTASDTPLVRDLVRRPGPRKRRVAVGVAVAAAAACVVAWTVTFGSPTPQAAPAAVTNVAPVAPSASTPSPAFAPPGPPPSPSQPAETKPEQTAPAPEPTAARASARPAAPGAAPAVPPVATPRTTQINPSAPGAASGMPGAGAAPVAAAPVVPAASAPGPDPLHLDTLADAGLLFRGRK
jgi:serine/threonine-protein kinase